MTGASSDKNRHTLIKIKGDHSQNQKVSTIMRPLHRQVQVLFHVIMWQTIQRSSPFSSSNTVRRCAPASPFGGSASAALFAATPSYSSDLNTALEWLAQDRCSSIHWFCPHTSAGVGDVASVDENASDIGRMPLYPVGVVHIPYSGENCTFVNIVRSFLDPLMFSLVVHYKIHSFSL